MMENVNTQVIVVYSFIYFIKYSMTIEKAWIIDISKGVSTPLS